MCIRDSPRRATASKARRSFSEGRRVGDIGDDRSRINVRNDGFSCWVICILITGMDTPKLLSPGIGIIADDLTSAADGAGPFLPWAGSARVRRGVAGPAGERVLSVDTGSRGQTEADAVDAVARVAAAPVSYTHLDVYKRQMCTTRTTADFRGCL